MHDVQDANASEYFTIIFTMIFTHLEAAHVDSLYFGQAGEGSLQAHFVKICEGPVGWQLFGQKGGDDRLLLDPDH